MKKYYPYNTASTTQIIDEPISLSKTDQYGNYVVHLDHIPKVGTLSITKTNGTELVEKTSREALGANEFYCDYRDKTLYRDATGVVYIGAGSAAGLAASYVVIGTPVTAADMNEIKAYMEQGGGGGGGGDVEPSYYFSERVTLAGGFNANSIRSNMTNATLSVSNSTLTGATTVQGGVFFDNTVSFDENIYLYNQGAAAKKNATVRADESTIAGNPHFTGYPDFVDAKFTRNIHFNNGDSESTVKGATVDFDRASLKGNPTITGNPTLTANPVFTGNPKFNKHVFFYTEQQDDSETSTVKGATLHLTNSTIAGAKASIDVNHAHINTNYSNATARYSTIDVRYASIQGGSGTTQAASISGNVVFTGTPKFTNGATGLDGGGGVLPVYDDANGAFRGNVTRIAFNSNQVSDVMTATFYFGGGSSAMEIALAGPVTIDTDS